MNSDEIELFIKKNKIRVLYRVRTVDLIVLLQLSYLILLAANLHYQKHGWLVYLFVFYCHRVLKGLDEEWSRGKSSVVGDCDRFRERAGLGPTRTAVGEHPELIPHAWLEAAQRQLVVPHQDRSCSHPVG